MRFKFSDPARLRRVAKLLKAELSRHGHDWPLHRCREVTAEACGYPTFHEAESSAGKGIPSGMDEAVPTRVAVDRRARQRSALLAQGLTAHLVDIMLAEVGFTSARRHSSPPLEAPAVALSARQGRIAAKALSGRKMRAGNFGSAAILDGAGEFIGIVLGTDGCFEHDECPEALLEAYGVTDGATTVDEARMRRARSTMTVTPKAFTTRADGGTLLHLNPGMDEFSPEDLSPTASEFHVTGLGRRWRSVSRDGELGTVTAWSHRQAAIVAFDAEGRDRLVEMGKALGHGSVSFAFHAATGPILVLSDKVGGGLTLDGLVQAVREAVHSPREGALTGSPVIRLDLAHTPTMAAAR